MFKRLLLPVVTALLFATAASPCGFHNYAPQPTFVDRLLGSDQIVLARSAPDNPFRFKAIAALEGDLDTVDLPFLVDSVTRRQLALNDDTAVLFVRDGAYGPWQRIALVDVAMAPVLDFVMARLPEWELGGDVERFSYFAGLVDHPDNRIHKMALRELDQADYSILRNLPIRIDVARLLPRLNDPQNAEFKPIRVLLLGLSGEDQLRAQLEAGVRGSITANGGYLGAFATALIELAGPEIVTDIASSYLTNPSLSLFTRELLIEAIALHGQTGDPAMGAAISDAIASTLWVEPDLAGTVARRFGSRSDWAHQDILQSLLADGSLRSLADKQDVSQYLTFAREAQENL